MAERCRPILRSTGKRAEASRVVALWRDVQAGEIEIALDAGDDACVLTLECEAREEYSADGRGDGSAAGCAYLLDLSRSGREVLELSSGRWLERV